jgi:16S rRNA (guanine966-N2)-methyltransferase
VGLEALSRGARQAVFVERDRAAARLIQANCSTLGVDEQRTRLLVRPALRAVADLARAHEVFGLAWADPPFELWQEGLVALARAFGDGVLDPTATACLECPQQADIELPEPLRIERNLKGGASRLVIIVTE